MAKIPTCALTLAAMYFLLNVKYVTVASNTTQPEFNNTSNSTIEAPGQPTTAVTQHHGSPTASAGKERLGNSDTNDTSNVMNTTLSTMRQGSADSMPTARPTKNDTDNMSRGVTTPAPGGEITIASSTIASTMASTAAQEKKKQSVINGIIILCAVIGLLLLILLFCFFQRRKNERNSFNLRSGSPDNVHIPLSSGVAEKNIAFNMKEDKIDLHPIEHPVNRSAMEASPKQAAASGLADGHEGESNSTASTVPKDDELDKLSLDSAKASLLPPSTGNMKEQDLAGDGNDAPLIELNENNNNSSQWAVLQLKGGGRGEEPYHAPPTTAATTRNNEEGLSKTTLMQADFEEDQGRCAGDFAQKSPFHDATLNLEP